jgi:hypothetical protein
VQVQPSEPTAHVSPELLDWVVQLETLAASATPSVAAATDRASEFIVQPGVQAPLAAHA